mgnify:CR=1 FL=1
MQIAFILLKLKAIRNYIYSMQILLLLYSMLYKEKRAVPFVFA